MAVINKSQKIINTRSVARFSQQQSQGSLFTCCCRTKTNGHVRTFDRVIVCILVLFFFLASLHPVEDISFDFLASGSEPAPGGGNYSLFKQFLWSCFFTTHFSILLASSYQSSAPIIINLCNHPARMAFLRGCIFMSPLFRTAPVDVDRTIGWILFFRRTELPCFIVPWCTPWWDLLFLALSHNQHRSRRRRRKWGLELFFSFPSTTFS